MLIKTVVLPSGTGYWETRLYPIGGSFRRAAADILVTVEETFRNYHGATAKGKVIATGEPIAFALHLVQEVSCNS